MRELNLRNDAAQKLLANTFASRGLAEAYISQQLRDLFNVGAYLTRFEQTASFFSSSSKSSLLVSGASVGSEIVAALQAGFKTIVATEVDPVYVEICKTRFGNTPGVHILLYDGDHLDIEDQYFTSIVSGHIIEHTRDPERYLREHLRLLKVGGIIFLEFPTRYYPIELHTRLPSLEWLPSTLRHAAYTFLSSNFSPLLARTRIQYRTIRDTLQPISVSLVRRWIRESGHQLNILASYRPARGCQRIIMQKTLHCSKKNDIAVMLSLDRELYASLASRSSSVADEIIRILQKETGRP